MNTTLSPAATYVDAVHAALADLPADDLAEIVEDVRDHVEQVSAELGEDATAAALEERLGTPAVYAAELRSAAGYPPGPGDVPADHSPRVRRQVVTWIVRIAVVLTLVALLEAFVTGTYGGALVLAIAAWLAAALAALVWFSAERSTGTGASLGVLPDARRVNGLFRWLRGKPLGAAVLETIIALRPAWWIARAWIAVELMGMFFLAQWFPLSMFPGAWLVFALAVVISVWLGRRAASHRQASGERVFVLLGNVVAVLGMAAVIGTLANGGLLAVHEESFPERAAYLGDVSTGAFREDGTPIVNLYPYGADGRLLENVRLYDQAGRPFSSVAYEGCMVDEMTGGPDLPALNVFPRSSSRYDEGPLGPRCRELGIVPPLGSTLPGSPSDTSQAPSPAPMQSVAPTLAPTPGP